MICDIEWAKEVHERIDKKWIEQVHKIADIITHFDWKLSQFLLAMGEAMEVMEEEDPCPWDNFQEYRKRKERAYHTAMGWMIEDEHTIPYTGEEQ